MPIQKLVRIALILLILVLTVIILRYARTFLIPLTFAGLLSMLLLPLVNWLQRKGFSKVLATLSGIFVLILFLAGLVFFISWQAADIAENASKMKQQFQSTYQQVQKQVSAKLGISKQKQQEMLQKQQSKAPSQASSVVTGVIGGIGGFLTNLVLVLVYTFLLIYFRGHIKRFILRLVPKNQEDNAVDIINRSKKVTQKYLTGLFIMIASLWIMYGIGFSIVGVKNAIFFGILCGVLEIVPFVGNLIGNGLTIIMVLIQGGGMNMVIGVLITYATVQFLQSYVLEPLIVGSEVNINPLFTIVGLVAGESLWGIPGMVLAIPIIGVAKIICDHVEPLKPFGELIGEDKKEGKGLKEKITGLFKKSERPRSHTHS